MSISEPLYDIIGDIHGQYGKLEALLGKLGYSHRQGLWTPPDGRMAVFLGDLIDRGPEQLKTLQAPLVHKEMTIAYTFVFVFCALAYLIAWVIMHFLVPKFKKIEL